MAEKMADVPPPPGERADQRMDDIFKVDREKTCPLLLRVFTNENEHHRVDEFRKKLPENELQIYTWLDCTLKELSSLIREVNPELREKGTMLSFATVFPDRRGMYKVKEIGTTVYGRKGMDDIKTLKSQRFQIGDYMSVAISRRPSRAPRMRAY